MSNENKCCLEDWQIRFLKMNYQEHTVKEIAEALTLDEQKIYRACRELGIKCKSKTELYGPKNPEPKQRRPVRHSDFVPKHKPMPLPEPTKKQLTRPPAIYTNSPSPYGIATEYHKQNRQQ